MNPSIVARNKTESAVHSYAAVKAYITILILRFTKKLQCLDILHNNIGNSETVNCYIYHKWNYLVLTYKLEYNRLTLRPI